MERDRREPDKLLCHVASMRRAASDSAAATPDPPDDAVVASVDARTAEIVKLLQSIDPNDLRLRPGIAKCLREVERRFPNGGTNDGA